MGFEQSDEHFGKTNISDDSQNCERRCLVLDRCDDFFIVDLVGSVIPYDDWMLPMILHCGWTDDRISRRASE
jgi:hypothetical protein